MPTNKNASFRYRVLNHCFTNRGHRKWTLDELVREVSNHLQIEFGTDSGVSMRTLQGDINVMRSPRPRAGRAPIDGSIGPHRTWAFSSASFDDVRAVRAECGGTVNDIVLTAVTAGYAALLRHRSEDLDRAVVRTWVPVSPRPTRGAGVPDKRVSLMRLELPVGVADHIDRLRVIQGRMTELKASHMVEVGELATTLGDLAPPMVIGPASRWLVGLLRRVPQRSVNTVTTNVPGPQFPLYCLGREMLSYLPYVPITHGLRVGTAILSYNGRLFFGVTGDAATTPDVDVLADATAAAVGEMRDQVGTTATR